MLKSSVPLEQASLLCLEDSIRIFTSAFLQNELITSQSIPMNDPASFKRMTIPCRSFECNHVQCFDLDVLRSMNKETRQDRSFFKCPVCNERRNPKKLYIDYVTLAVLDIYRTSDSIELYNNGIIQISPGIMSIEFNGLVINSIYDLKDITTGFRSPHFNTKTIQLKELNYTSVSDINNMINTTQTTDLFLRMKHLDKKVDVNDIEKLRPFCALTWEGLTYAIRSLPGVGRVKSSSIVADLVKEFEARAAKHLMKLTCGPSDGEVLSSRVVNNNVASSQVFDMTIDLSDDEENHVCENSHEKDENLETDGNLENVNRGIISSATSSSSNCSSDISIVGPNVTALTAGAFSNRSLRVNEQDSCIDTVPWNVSPTGRVFSSLNSSPMMSNIPFESLLNTTESNLCNGATSSGSSQISVMNSDLNVRLCSINNSNNSNDTRIVESSGISTSIVSQPSVSINSITSHPVRHKGSANWITQVPISTVRISRGPQRSLDVGEKPVGIIFEKLATERMKEVYCSKCSDELKCSSDTIKRYTLIIIAFIAILYMYSRHTFQRDMNSL